MVSVIHDVEGDNGSDPLKVAVPKEVAPLLPANDKVIVYRPSMVFGVSIKLGTTAAYECTTAYIAGMYFFPLTAVTPQCGMLRKSMKVWI